jgi:hypothetical protein
MIQNKCVLEGETLDSLLHIKAYRLIDERKKQTIRLVFAAKESSSCTSGGTSTALSGAVRGALVIV